MPRFRVRAICTVLVLCLIGAPLTASAQGPTIFTPRRTFGVLFIGGSLFMAKKSLDFHGDADDIYEAYRLAGDSDQADRLYERASDRDTKSQMSLGLSLILLAGGLRLLLSSGVDDNVPKHQEKLKQESLKIEMTGNPTTGSVGLALSKDF